MATRTLRTADDVDRFRAALISVDQAFWDSEQRWGVGRLERIISPGTLASYRRGWDAYRAALEAGDPDALESIGPKMVKALAVMDTEATATGHKPLAPDTWETGMADGTVLVICRSNAEATATIRRQKTTMFSAAPHGGMTVAVDDRLPPDLAVTVREQHDGRRLEVWTLAEIARLIEQHGSVAGDRSAKAWEGSPAPTGRQQDEMAAHDHARSGYPLEAPLDTPAPSAVVLPF
jgi:hypothetical protein